MIALLMIRRATLAINGHTTATALLRLTVVAHFHPYNSTILSHFFFFDYNRKKAPPFSGLPSSTSPENDGD
jgi:hypothetical protein